MAAFRLGALRDLFGRPDESKRRKPEEAQTKLEVLREEARAARQAPQETEAGDEEAPEDMKQDAREKVARGARKPGEAVRQLHGRRHRGAGGPGAGASSARHVRRRHRREGAAPPVRRGDRQLHGRGGRRPCQLDRGGAGGGRISVGHRQRPRHPHRSASQVQVEVRPRSDHDHPALGRQVRLQGLQHLGRPARRRRLRRQCALREARGRGRARPAALRHDLQPRRPARQAAEAGRHQEPARHQGALQARREDLRQGRHLQAGAPVPHGPLQGLPVRRRRDPLDRARPRSSPTTRRPRRASTSPAA